MALVAMDRQLSALLLVFLGLVLGAALVVLVVQRNTRRIEASRLAEERRTLDLACRDPLTGLFNRRCLDEVAGEPTGAATRLLFLIDLDSFKHINDTYGHITGDEVLRKVSDRLRAVSGPLEGARPVRLGGDEFLLIATGEINAIESAFLEQVTPALELDIDGTSIKVEMSVGVTPWSAGMSLETALKQADLGMYEAKRTGAGLCRCDSLPAKSSGSHSERLKRVFERQLAASPDYKTASICVAAIRPDRYDVAKRALGHSFAAKLLRSVRERLREDDQGFLVERIGADTLGILFVADDAAETMRVVDVLDELCSQIHGLDGSATYEALTIGVAGPASAASLRDTVEQAQFALDEARRTGRRQVLFDLREQETAANNVALMADLREAIANDQLELHYQPKLCSRTGEIDSFEALARWRHPARGEISPGVFIPVAEASGDVEALTYWAIKRAVDDWSHLAATGIARPIYVNISAKLIGSPTFALCLLSMLHGQSGRIGIEITETAVLSNPDQALKHLHEIAKAGISIAIDDYGVGLSSLSYLKQLPASELKIDMSFITHLAESHRDPMIVRSTIDLAHGLGLRVTAEGVDKPEVLTLLKIMGCDMVQGYQVSAALSVQEIAIFMQGHDKSAEHVPDCAAQLIALVES